MALHNGLTRRDFLWTAAAGAATGLSVGASGALAAATPKPILPHGVLGRTKYPATLVSFGAILISDKSGTRVLKSAIDAGLNLVHTSASYVRGKSILAIGELFRAEPAYRDKVFICLKSFRPDQESEITGMLKTLNTDHADLLLSTMDKPDPKRLELIQASQDKLKAKGLIRHTGFVCHGDMSGVIEMVLDKAPKYFDATLLSTAPLNDSAEKKDRFKGNLAGLRKQGVGIISMKSGARDASKKGAPVFQAHVKSLLEAGCDTVLTSIDTFDQVGLIKGLELKGSLSPTEKQAAALFRDSRSQACLMCADCTKACPAGVPVNDLMRIAMYHDEYGWLDHARSEYGLLPAGAAALAAQCGDCHACTDACPRGLASAAGVRRVTELFA